MPKPINITELPVALQRFAGAIEFAGVEAVTKTALKARKAAVAKMHNEFVVRNKWTPKSVRFTPATMQRKYAEIWIADEYIAEQETGATRSPESGGTPIPAQIRDLIGIPETKVIPRSVRARQITGKKKKGLPNKPFVAKVNNTLGVWVRETASRLPIVLLYVLYTKAKRIRKRPWYRKPINDTYDSNIEPEYNAAVDRAIDRFMKKYI